MLRQRPSGSSWRQLAHADMTLFAEQSAFKSRGGRMGLTPPPNQRMSRIKLDAACDTVLLVLMDNATLDAREMWEAPFSEVKALLEKPGSKLRERGALGILAFKRIAKRIWISNS